MIRNFPPQYKFPLTISGFLVLILYILFSGSVSEADCFTFKLFSCQVASLSVLSLHLRLFFRSVLCRCVTRSQWCL